MKLPNGHLAIVDDAKLRDYCLSPTHPRGRHKARMFAAALGLTAGDADLLKSALLHAAASLNAVPLRNDEHGQRYGITFAMTGRTATASVTSVWIVDPEDEVARLITCYPA